MSLPGAFSGPGRKFLVLSLLCQALAWAGPKLTFDDGRKSVELMQAYQLWSVATFDPGNVPETDPRADVYLRRARLGLRGQARPGLGYLVWFAYDNVGKDPNTGTLGAAQVMANTAFQVWDAYFTWHLDSTWANLTGGLFRPIAGREFTTSFTAVPSLEKALTHYYLRDHLHSRPSGRETGLNLGGWRADSAAGWAFGYNFGAFDAAQEKVAGVAAGSLLWSPLLALRLTATLGTPENKDYRLASELNSFGKRRGLTLGGYAAWQGETDERLDTALANPYLGGFRQSSAAGVDLLFNWRYLEIDGEVACLWREFSDGFVAQYAASGKAPGYRLSPDYRDWVWHARGGYSFPLPAPDQFLEPTAAYSRFHGDAGSLPNTGGEDSVLDLGLNWHVQKQSLKLGLHYAMQEGKARSLFTQGPNRRGELRQRNDYVALALLAGL